MNQIWHGFSVHLLVHFQLNFRQALELETISFMHIQALFFNYFDIWRQNRQQFLSNTTWRTTRKNFMLSSWILCRTGNIRNIEIKPKTRTDEGVSKHVCRDTQVWRGIPRSYLVEIFRLLDLMFRQKHKIALFMKTPKFNLGLVAESVNSLLTSTQPRFCSS